MSGGKAQESCPKQKGTIAVVFVRSDIGKPIQGASVSVQGPTPGSGTTDNLGAFILKDRTPGAYTARVTLPASMRGYGMTLETTKGSVSAGGSEILLFKAAPVGNLHVELYDDRGQLVTEEAQLAASGPSSPSQSGKTGSHTFNSIPAGTYQVSATVPAALFEVPTVSKPGVAVPAGGTLNVRLDVKRKINVITPKIELEYRVVLLDRKLSSHQAGAENKIVTDDVVRVRVMAHQSTGSPAYAGHGKFEASPGNVEVYIDKECKNALAGRKISNQQLLGGTVDLYLKAKSKGKFKVKLTLDPSSHPNHQVKDPAEEEMGVVELEMKLHRYETADLDIAVDPDVEPYSAYYTELKAKALPAQKAMSDADKVKEGRLLHAQAANSHARAKLVLQKLAAGDWPAGTDDYLVALSQQNASGSVKLFDKDWEGAERSGDALKFKVSDLKAKEVELWVEGEGATKKLRQVVLGAGLERGAMAAPHTVEHPPKRNADWVRFTVVKVKEVKVDYKPESKKPVAWDEAKERFYVNLKADPDGRKVTIAATLTEPIKGVPLYFMLAEDTNNMKTAHWGVDLPATWKWKDIDAAVKHSDKPDRKKLLHLSQATDDKGAAKKELTLSRFGGDVFHPAAYIEQDPQLAKYVHGHVDLAKKKPVLAAKKITVWRRFWYQEVKVKGLAVAGFGNAADTYNDVKATMEAAPAIEMKRSDADAIRPRVIYPKHMLSYYVDTGTNAYRNNYAGDASDGLAVGDATESKFFALVKKTSERPVQVPMLNAHGLWVADGTTAGQSTPWTEIPAKAFPLPFDAAKELLDPPLQGGTLLFAGRWEAQDWDDAANAGAGAWVNPRHGDLAAGDLSLDASRSDPHTFQIGKPARLTLGTKTRVRFTGLRLRGAVSYLGTSYADGIVNCYTPNDEVDFINTINHELGHSFKQVTKVRPTGVPAHPHQYDKQGSHCNYQNKSCLMYESGPQAVHLDRYCPVCHPYVLVQDMSSV
jgi:hypothetical protein